MSDSQINLALMLFSRHTTGQRIDLSMQKYCSNMFQCFAPPYQKSQGHPKRPLVPEVRFEYWIFLSICLNQSCRLCLKVISFCNESFNELFPSYQCFRAAHAEALLHCLESGGRVHNCTITMFVKCLLANVPVKTSLLLVIRTS